METNQEIQYSDYTDGASFHEHVRTIFTVMGIAAVIAAGMVMHQSVLFSYILLAYAFTMIAILLKK